jgi:hypothetical protein
MPGTILSDQPALCQHLPQPSACRNVLTRKILRLESDLRHRACEQASRRVAMFAASVALIGVIGIFIVRRRSARKKQGLA